MSQERMIMKHTRTVYSLIGQHVFGQVEIISDAGEIYVYHDILNDNEIETILSNSLHKVRNIYASFR